MYYLFISPNAIYSILRDMDKTSKNSTRTTLKFVTKMIKVVFKSQENAIKFWYV